MKLTDKQRELAEKNKILDFILDKLNELEEQVEKDISVEIGVEKVATKLATKLATLEKGDKGDRGDDGHTPTRSELVSLIQPLIPDPVPGKPGKDGRDGKDGIDYVLTKEDKKAIASLIDVPIVEQVIREIPETSAASINFVIDGQGNTILQGTKGELVIPFDCTIREVSLLADTNGSVSVDILKSTYDDYPASGGSITGVFYPAINNDRKYINTTLFGWDTAIAAGDILRFQVRRCSAITRVLVNLIVWKN